MRPRTRIRGGMECDIESDREVERLYYWHRLMDDRGRDQRTIEAGEKVDHEAVSEESNREESNR